MPSSSNLYSEDGTETKSEDYLPGEDTMKDEMIRNNVELIQSQNMQILDDALNRD